MNHLPQIIMLLFIPVLMGCLVSTWVSIIKLIMKEEFPTLLQLNYYNIHKAVL